MLEAISLIARDVNLREVRRAAVQERLRAATQGRVPWSAYAADRVPKTEPGKHRLLEGYHGWVYKAATVIANRIAEIRFELVAETQDSAGKTVETPIINHPLFSLLGGGVRRPNPMSTAHHLRKLTQIDLELTGNAYWLKVRNRLGEVVELWRLRPDKMIPIADKETGLLIGWGWLTAATTDSKTAAFPAKDVVHFKYPHPVNDPWEGASPLKAAAYAFDIELANKKFQKSFFDNGTQLSLVLSSDQPISTDKATEILDAFEARHRGVENMWLPLILGSGLTATPMSALNKELEAIALMEFTRDDILSTYGVPKSKIGLGDALPRAVAEALDVTFNKETINPRLAGIREQMEADLLPDFPMVAVEGVSHAIRFSNPVPEDREFKLKETESLVAKGGLRVDEMRGRHELAPFGNEYGESVILPAGGKPVDPELPLDEISPPTPAFSFGDLGGDGEAPPLPPKKKPEEEEEDEEEDEPRARPRFLLLGEPGAQTLRDTRTGDMFSLVPQPWHGNRELRSSIWERTEARRHQWERIMAGAVLRAFDEQNGRIFRVMKEAFAHGKPSVAHLVQALNSIAGRRARAEVYRAAAAIIERIFRTDGQMALELAQAAKPKRAAKGPVPTGYSWQRDAALHLQRRRNLIEGVSDFRFRRIIGVIREAMGEPDWDGGSGAIADRIKEFLGGDDARALLVSRTESGSAANSAAMSGFRAGGANAKGWLATPDDRTRESHADIDGEVVLIGQEFTNGLQYPGDPSGPAEEVCNCRCTVTPEFLD